MDEKIKSLDLTYLEDRLIKAEKWLKEDAIESVRRYKKFLYLILKHPNVTFVPDEDIDEVWHAHILHTKQYHRDCLNIFGRFIHHRPVLSTDTDQDRKQMVDNFELTSSLYFDEFNEFYPKNFHASELI